MSDLPHCPYCGSPTRAGRPSARERTLDSLYREVRRIREIAEARQDGHHPRRLVLGQQARAREAGEAGMRVEELIREVNELRATVARLRGTAVAGLAGSR